MKWQRQRTGLYICVGLPYALDVVSDMSILVYSLLRDEMNMWLIFMVVLFRYTSLLCVVGQ